ncbi:hypothetical protein HK101_004255 [Irineochytrium annulatum]|nr:hypothetical protein HK101_004255 [Irineochytrium annulatum]
MATAPVKVDVPDFRVPILQASCMSEATMALFKGSVAGAVVGGAFGYWIDRPLRATVADMGRKGALFAGTIQQMAAHTVFLGALSAFGDGIGRNLDRRHKPTSEEVNEKRSETFFEWPRRDPYAARWEEIKKREAAKEE